MKKIILLFLCFISFELSAQLYIENTTNDDWVIKVNQENISAPAGSIMSVPLAPCSGVEGSDMGVFLDSNSGCAFKLPGAFNVAGIGVNCAPSTSVIFYKKYVVNPNGCVEEAIVSFY